MNPQQKPDPSLKISRVKEAAISTTQQTEELNIKQIREKKLSEFEKKLDYLFSFLDIFGKKLIGNLWETFYLTVQDTIALLLLFQLPSLIGKFTVGNDFSNFKSCFEPGWSWSSVNVYTCSIIVASSFTMWILIAGRILGRFLKNLFKF